MPEKRTMSLTSDLVALCYREEPNMGLDSRFTPLTDDDYRVLAEKLEAESDHGPLWVFAYGSLIWKPEFDSVEMKPATAFGWHRAFTLEINSWRGSREQPGLMMALARGGRCDGVIYRLPDGNRLEQIERMLRREVSETEGVQAVRWLPVRTVDGPQMALGFWVGETPRSISHRHPPSEVAHILARACGHIGSGAEYLYNTVSHLEEFGIRDRNLWRLQALVADEIRRLHRLEEGAKRPGAGHHR
ncbi:cation transport protein ChaC [Pararhizobium capsulatum DSM 1112]|uniref:glutathione-specific gamma-glutamylcyclotransferase n=1 Tax=Pararhizobium capsulatum DSM 1112 TaxID=1121113 RepID=A0ABU0BMP7_9HYPH|nr:gamma-glutamylcyclotransferase [Pararhizobium capsulatum]MDQ0319528.1 cation transport protein ChaC [Pararhizobium capsulatum DSM 1112]